LPFSLILSNPILASVTTSNLATSSTSAVTAASKSYTSSPANHPTKV